MEKIYLDPFYSWRKVGMKWTVLLLFLFLGISLMNAQECSVASGTISTDDPTTICALDGTPDPINVSVNGSDGPSSAWIITDLEGVILGLPPAPPFDLEGAGAGTCLIWYLVHDGELEGVEPNAPIGLITGCYDLSNPIAVFRDVAEGGELTTAGGMTELTICAGDGESDAFDVILEGAEGANSAWIITDDQLNILGTPPSPPFDLEGAGAGTCLIWHLSYANGVSLDVANAADLEGCYDLSNPITVYRNVAEGGSLTTADGQTELMICAGDGISDAFDVTLEGADGPNSAWIITDDQLNILGTPPSPPFD
ncbi:MAG: hypothetical protein KTR13_05825, partial [Saprospiraceae bacterium]|nr:hypothetical protein [Saprospiraceae bacterium]